MSRFLKSLALAALVAIGGVSAAQAQTDQRYYVGAIDKGTLDGGLATTVVAAAGTAQTITVPQYGSSAYHMTLTGNLVLTLTTTNFVAGFRQSVVLVLVQDATAGRTITWPTGTKWQGGTAPTFTTTAGTVYQITLTSDDGGATILAK